MDTAKSPWTWGLLLGGVLLIALSLFFGRKQQSSTPASILARAEKLTGSAFRIRASTQIKEIVDRTTSLGHLDSLETGDLGEVRLDFNGAERLRILEQSFVTLENLASGSVVVILKRGALRVENAGSGTNLYIAKNGERIAAAEYEESPLAQVATREDSAPSVTPPLSGAAPLSEKEIQDVMATHRHSFLRCYTQVLQKNPNAKGSVNLTFTIENSGKISAVEIASGPLRQEDFKKCLLEVMNRIEFRPFSGPPLSTLFPLQFE